MGINDHTEIDYIQTHQSNQRPAYIRAESEAHFNNIQK